MSAEAFVRAARAGDAEDLARIQTASWRAGYAGLVPAPVLAELTTAGAEHKWREQWQASVAKPPTSRHRVLVAVETADGPSGQGRGDDSRGTDRQNGSLKHTVAGFASFGPAIDPDLWPATDAELYELRVHPEYTGRGHGSRLLNAVAGTVAQDGFHTLSAWVLEADSTLRGFLASAGWAPDGARRELDMGSPVPQIRVHAAVGV